MGPLCMLCLLATGAGPGDGLSAMAPVTPRWAPAAREPPGHAGRWWRVGLVWGSIAFDYASSEYALRSNPALEEGFPLFRGAGGRLSTARYFALMAPLGAFATYANIRYGRSKAVRVLTYITGAERAGVAFHNLSQAK